MHHHYADMLHHYADMLHHHAVSIAYVRIQMIGIFHHDQLANIHRLHPVIVYVIHR